MTAEAGWLHDAESMRDYNMYNILQSFKRLLSKHRIIYNVYLILRLQSVFFTILDFQKMWTNSGLHFNHLHITLPINFWLKTFLSVETVLFLFSEKFDKIESDIYQKRLKL